MKKHNFRNAFFLFASILCLSFIVNYNSISKEKKDNAEESYKRISSIITENLDQVEKILIFVGRKISTENPNLDLDAIHKIFVQTANIYNSNNIFSWSLFDWVDDKNHQTVNTLLGVNRDNSPDMSSRYYTVRGSDKWVMLFSNTIFGNPSKIMVIPVGVQIETKLHPRAGIVVVGINVRKLTNIIEPLLDKNIKFLVIDERDDKFAFGSYESDHLLGQSFRKMPQSLDGVNYVFEKKMDNKYPYKIWVGYNKKAFWHEVFYSSLILTIQIIGVAVCVSFMINKSSKK